jgi:hypothetical protein
MAGEESANNKGHLHEEATIGSGARGPLRPQCPVPDHRPSVLGR